MSRRTNRRRFLQTSAVTGIGFWVAGGVRAQQGSSPNEKIAIACIGIGGKGSSDAADAGNNGDVVAICDVDEGILNNAGGKRFPKAKRYTDFRKMLDEMERRIDALVIATPDHTHAVIAARAMKRGKHVYVEKPIAHDVDEARTLRRIANEQKVATQQGNQGMATDSFRRTLELVQEGVIGEIREAHVWYVFGGSGPRQRPKETPPVPDYLDWDCFLGPAIELMLLGNVASLVGQPLEFDPVPRKIANNDEADRALRPERRESWAL